MIHFKTTEKTVLFETYVSLKRIGHGKRTGDPTERIHHMRRHTIHDARYWIADILCGRND